MIHSLSDPEEFRRQRLLAWERNVDYWLNGPLRHVDDVGCYIADRVAALCDSHDNHKAVLVDMGFGSGWLLRALLEKNTRMSYLGLDSMEEFVNGARKKFEATQDIDFLLADVERRMNLPVAADVVVNAFNFFELCDLRQAMNNVARLLVPGGTLFMSTIDKTFLLMALSKDCAEFIENLARYQQLSGIKYAFQRIDLGTHVSEILEYPSVLYSTQDFIDAAGQEGLHLVRYVEHPFTAKPVPKIYCHLEFRKTTSCVNEE